MLRRRAVSETLRLHCSNTRWMCSQRTRSADIGRSAASAPSSLWLNLDPSATVGRKLDNIMILRGQGLKELWVGLGDGRLPRAGFSATYVSPGKVRTAQATAVALSGPPEIEGRPLRGCVVVFETLAGRN